VKGNGSDKMDEALNARSIDLVVPPEFNQKRLDLFLGTCSPFSRTRGRALVESGRVAVDGRIADRPALKVFVGAVVHIDVPLPTPSELIPEPIPIEILYEDSDVAVVNKPSGMVVHPADGVYTGTLVNALLYHLEGLSGIGGRLRPGIVHRLDKETSGAIIVAKNDLAHQRLAEQFKSRETEKEYVALVQGIPTSREFTVDAPIGRHPTDRKQMAVLRSGGRRAISRFRVETCWHGFALIRAFPMTGRTHQIRVHLSSRHLPVVGDLVYGYRNRGKLRTGLALLCDQRGGFFLHSHKITLRHPASGETVTYEAPIEPVFLETIEALDRTLEREGVQP